ncbi:MAG: hypothetical protein R3E09_10815 [Novosphingobium sp.]
MKNLTKALVGTVAAGAMAVSTATPAMARDRDGGISTGEVIAGALIIGGIAAVAAAASDNDRDRYRYGNDYRYDRPGYRNNYGLSPREAVSRCVAAAESHASRYSYGSADVTDIRSVKNKRNGYNVTGRIAVNTYGRGWNKGDRLRGHGYDSGKFTCKVRYGRVTDIDYSGIRGLR